MKGIMMVLAGVMVLAMTLTAVADEGRLDTSVDIGYFSRYVVGSGITIHNNSAYQQSILVSDSSGLYVKLWNSYTPEDGFNSDFGDEVDYIAGIYKSYGGVGIDVSYAYYNLYDMDDTNGDLHAVCLVVLVPEIYKFSPYLLVEGDIPQDKDILEGGLYYKIGAETTLDLIPSLPLNLNFMLGGHDGAFGRRPEKVSFARAIIATTFKVWKFDLTPEVNFQKDIGYDVDDGGMAEDKVWWGLNASIAF